MVRYKYETDVGKNKGYEDVQDMLNARGKEWEFVQMESNLKDVCIIWRTVEI